MIGLAPVMQGLEGLCWAGVFCEFECGGLELAVGIAYN